MAPVEAMVYSVTDLPVSIYDNASGINSNFDAFLIDVEFFRSLSLKMVLKSMCCMPVVAYNRSALITSSKKRFDAPSVMSERYAVGSPMKAPSPSTLTKSTPQVSMPIEVGETPIRATALRPSLI